MRVAGLEPARPWTQEPKSCASANSATPAWPHCGSPRSRSRASPPLGEWLDGRMQVSARVDYGTRALAELASRPGQLVTSEELAELQGIPVKFLEGILTQLRRAGLVLSKRGAEGGYRLARPAAEIAVADVFRALDGPIAAVRGHGPGGHGLPGCCRAPSRRLGRHQGRATDRPGAGHARRRGQWAAPGHRPWHSWPSRVRGSAASTGAPGWHRRSVRPPARVAAWPRGPWP